MRRPLFSFQVMTTVWANYQAGEWDAYNANITFSNRFFNVYKSVSVLMVQEKGNILICWYEFNSTMEVETKRQSAHWKLHHAIRLNLI